MRIEYQYADLRMAIALSRIRNGFRIEHHQHFGKPGSILEKVLGSIKSEAQLTLLELEILASTLTECLHPKIEIVKGMHVVRDDDASMLYLEFSNSFGAVPIPHHVVQYLIDRIGALATEASPGETP